MAQKWHFRKTVKVVSGLVVNIILSFVFEFLIIFPFLFVTRHLSKNLIPNSIQDTFSKGYLPVVGTGLEVVIAEFLGGLFIIKMLGLHVHNQKQELRDLHNKGAALTMQEEANSVKLSQSITALSKLCVDNIAPDVVITNVKYSATKGAMLQFFFSNLMNTGGTPALATAVALVNTAKDEIYKPLVAYYNSLPVYVPESEEDKRQQVLFKKNMQKVDAAVSKLLLPKHTHKN